jgi:hypothetical protein
VASDPGAPCGCGVRIPGRVLLPPVSARGSNIASSAGACLLPRGRRCSSTGAAFPTPRQPSRRIHRRAYGVRHRESVQPGGRGHPPGHLAQQSLMATGLYEEFDATGKAMRIAPLELVEPPTTAWTNERLPLPPRGHGRNSRTARPPAREDVPSARPRNRRPLTRLDCLLPSPRSLVL